MLEESVELNTPANKKPETESKQAAADPPSYAPTPAESAALQKYWSRRKEKTSPRLKLNNTGGQARMRYDHPHQGIGAALFQQSLGTVDDDFASGLMTQLSRLAHSRDGKPDEELLNFLFSIVKGVNPRDETEALIAAAMAGVHMTVMKTVDQFDQAITTGGQEMAQRMIIRLTRTFVSLVEELTRYRRRSSK